MRFTILATALAATATLVSAVPAPKGDAIHLQLPFGYNTFDVAIPDWFQSNDVCPDLKVSCVKDGKTVGDIGKKPYQWEGIKKLCKQSEPEKNTAECNLRFANKCAAHCEAQGPLGGHGI
ncbi:unnamed protein product [Tilletia controversa]|uniref:Uncharacterized protein n=3 Tax=Tilletia TaxID=13289 RepID=A0A8X7T0V2_9BASI|nr:hypothetical protein CF336_g4747 [Tilletia laevis]KAE8195481.1 hypothetical protein CF328_g4425 [Tilletia controversa]KAE8252986.1 hypothetical protein A4X03_0g6018 [Tilletia caries]KAE8200614.1 hypothetical protein CF335_g3924 [Tilletia laevis]KAE8254821.1 hypothetical protein A4X06_0g708 [Tilletia controversa]